ncbi:MAG: PKD domain-containing protein [Methanoregula sp.]
MKTKIIILLIALLVIAIPASAVSQYTYTDPSNPAYAIVEFNGTAGNASWTVPVGVTSVEYLVVAGGGGGGGGPDAYGGGGAGGVISGTLSVIGVSSVPVTVGAGGSGASGDGAGYDGTYSAFSLKSATGGGGGGAWGAAGHNGGSGGGGSFQGNGGGTGVSGEGHNGGTGAPTGNYYGGGGGGGASAPGGTGSGMAGGNGGSGVTSSITGSSKTYGGGGGGSVFNGGGTGGSGGAGGGGNGASVSSVAVAGTDGLGGGGGGGSADQSNRNGGAGGSGVVIIRYLTPTGSAPVAAFSGTPVSGSAPLSAQFTDTSSGSPTSWLWNFGDGQTSSLQNPLHIFNSTGTYTVSLTATNAAGPDTLTKSGYITVNPPSASGTMSIGSGEIGQPGESILLNLTLNSAPQGLSGYNLNVNVANPSVARISSVSFPAWASDLHANSTLPASQNVLISASDVNHLVESGATQVTLASILVTGLSAGESDLTISTDNLNDDAGLGITPDLVPGHIIVHQQLTDPAIYSITPLSGNTTGSVTIALNGTGFQAGTTIRLTKSGQADITATNVVVPSQDSASGTFDLSGKQPGAWTITISNPNGKSAALANAFTIVQPVIPIDGLSLPPLIINNNGLYEDLNANGHLDYADVNWFWNKHAWIAANEPVTGFDIDQSGNVTQNDARALFMRVFS